MPRISDEEYAAFQQWRDSQEPDDDELDDDELDDEDDDEDQDDDGGVFILTRKRADAFLASMFPETKPKPKPRRRRDDADQDAGGDELPPQDPPSSTKEHRYFASRNRG